MNEDLILEIESKLQYSFNNKRLLQQAFTHSSFANVNKVHDNERFEFLGDAILDAVVSEYLCDNFPQVDVGQLSIMRAKVVSSDGLRPIVDKMDVLKCLRVGDGASYIIKTSKKIESNLYEAIVAAIYLDGGIDCVKKFVLTTLGESLKSVGQFNRKDPKTLLQEYCQKKKSSVPYYKLLDRSGNDNNPTYTVGLYLDNELQSKGEGQSKKKAEQSAAEKLVTKWRIDSAIS